MKLADEMLLAQMRESALKDVPADQWELVVGEVEKAGGVRQVQGYAKTLLHDAIAKASFGGDRSEAGRYAANVRWQAKGQAGKEGDGSGRKVWKGATEERLIRLFHRRYFDAEGPGSSQEEDELFKERGWLTSEGKVNPQILERGGAVGKYPIPADATFDDKEAFDRADAEELKEGNLADDLPNPNMPPLYNDYGDEPGDDERAGAKLREAMVPLDTKNPEASQARTTPSPPSKREKSPQERKALDRKIQEKTTQAQKLYQNQFSRGPETAGRQMEQEQRVLDRLDEEILDLIRQRDEGR